ncbi:large conductance mechanosensitive channel protein MscL [Microbacterium sp.]|uniref:large conductance mechanosensitive channel protein MscL n=1 Tax=Microbacterium sp. TaxID=51671 RepID=UPI0037CB95B8
MIKGFKEFIMRGNVIDLAVAVVIGAAFTLVVNAFVDGIINPLIGLFFQADSLNDLTIGVFAVGAVIGAIINFLAVALVVYFVFVYPMNKLKERQAAKAGVVDEAELPSEQQLLVQIRDLLEKQSS